MKGTLKKPEKLRTVGAGIETVHELWKEGRKGRVERKREGRGVYIKHS